MEDIVEPHLGSGALERVLLDWCEPFDGYFLYCPNSVITADGPDCLPLRMPRAIDPGRLAMHVKPS